MSASSVPVVMPRLGESIVEGTLVAWRARPGDLVRRGEVIADVETDKATSEIYAPADGTLVSIATAEGETVEVGATLALIRPLAAGAAADPGSPAASADVAASPVSAGAAEVPLTADPGGSRAVAEARSPATRDDGFGEGSPFGWSEAPVSKTASAPPPRAPAASRLPSRRLAPRPVDRDGGPIRSSPAVRRLARAHDLDVFALTGSGAGGRVTKADVLEVLAGRASAPPSATVPPPGQAYRLSIYTPTEVDTIEPFSRRRAQVADHMITSLATAAHVAAVTEIDMRAVLAAKRTDAGHPSAAGAKLSLTAYIVHALARALAAHPRLNASVRGRELILRGERNIGVAVDTDAGLVVPVVHRADELGVLGVARRLAELVEAARQGSLRPEMVQGGSFTLSNPGPDGNLFGVSVIRQPEVAILRTGAVVKRAVVRTVDGEDAIVIRPMMYAALSYDHRVIDGRAGNAFLRAFVDRLEGMAPQLG